MGRGGDGDDDGADDEEDGDDDPDEVHLDGGDDGDDFPSPGGISPADFCLPESSFLLWCFPPRSGGGTLLVVYL